MKLEALVVVRLSETESRQVGTKVKELVELSNPDKSGLGIIPSAALWDSCNSVEGRHPENSNIKYNRPPLFPS